VPEKNGIYSNANNSKSMQRSQKVFGENLSSFNLNVLLMDLEKVLEKYEKKLETYSHTEYLLRYLATKFSFCLLKNLMNFSGGNAIFFSMPKLKPRYLCDDTSKSIEGTFELNVDKYSFHSPNYF
jgi:hypothetical protein